MIRFGLPSYWNSTSSTLYGGPNPYHDYFYGGWNLALEQLSGSGGNQSVHYDWGRDLSGTLDGAGGVGGLLATEVNGVWYFPLYDNNGNVTDYVSETGEVVASYAYDAFGRTLSATGSMASVFPFRFSTKYYDAETKLYYYGERFYSPEMGLPFLNCRSRAKAALEACCLKVGKRKDKADVGEIHIEFAP